MVQAYSMTPKKHTPKYLAFYACLGIFIGALITSDNISANIMGCIMLCLAAVFAMKERVEDWYDL